MSLLSVTQNVIVTLYKTPEAERLTEFLQASCHDVWQAVTAVRSNAEGVRYLQPRVGAQRQPWEYVNHAFNPERVNVAQV